MIKVLFFMDGIGNAGGIQEMAIKWMENIDRSKVKIDILTYNHVKADNYKDRVKALGGEVYVIESFQDKNKFLLSMKQTASFFEQHSDYNIIHAHASSKAFFVLWFAKRSGIKVRILHSHATRFVMTGLLALMAAYILKPLANIMATHYFACSPEAGNFLFGKHKKVFIAHNGVDTDVFSPNTSVRIQMRKELIGEDNCFLIGNVGRFRPQKNHKFLMEIFKEVCSLDNKSKLVCVGGGELENIIKEKARLLGILDRVLFLGVRKDVNNLMQAFDLLVMPSLFEGLPVTGVEAQAVGTPCLFASTISKDAAILPNTSYLKLEDSPKIWAEKILSYKNQNRIDNATEYVRQKGYDILLDTQKLQNFYFKELKKYE